MRDFFDFALMVLSIFALVFIGSVFVILLCEWAYSKIFGRD